MQKAAASLSENLRHGLIWDSVSTQMVNQDMAVLLIRNFTDATPDLLRKNLTELKSKGIKGLIVDLRGNQGGAFEKTTESIEHFIPKNKVIVKAIKRGPVQEDLIRKGEPILSGVPLVVLINGHTKSDAEIMASALKMSEGATTVGTHTSGKWSAQSVDELPNKFAIKYTTATFLALDGSDLGARAFSQTSLSSSMKTKLPSCNLSVISSKRFRPMCSCRQRSTS